MPTNLSSAIEKQHDIVQYKITTTPMPSMIPAAADEPDVGLRTEEDARGGEKFRQPEKAEKEASSRAAPSSKKVEKALDLLNLKLGPTASQQSQDYDDNHDFGGDDDNNHYGGCCSGGSSSLPSDSNESGCPVSSTLRSGSSSSSSSSSSAYHHVTTNPQPTLSTTPGAGWANKSSCRGQGCPDRECNTRAATNEGIDGAHISDGRAETKNFTNEETSKSDRTRNIIEGVIDNDPVLRQIQEKLKHLADKYGYNYVGPATHADTMEDITMGWAMNFPPKKEEFIAQNGLLTLRDDSFPKSKCQRSNFKTMVTVLQHHFEKTEDEAKQFVLKNTIVFNRLCCDGPSDWKSDKKKRSQYEEFCRESDPIVKEFIHQLITVYCPNLQAILLFGEASHETFYKQRWIDNTYFVQKGIKLPHALRQLTGWQTKNDLFNVICFMIDTLHRAIHGHDHHDIEVHKDLTKYRLPYRNRKKSMCWNRCCGGNEEGKWVDLRKVRQGNEHFVVCWGSTRNHDKSDFLSLEEACENCYLNKKCDNMKICSDCNNKKRRCKFDSCNKRAVNKGVCVEHGAEVKRCSTEGCDNRVVNNGVCIRHGAEVKRCSTDGCNKCVVNNGVCVQHGAKVKRCSAEGCDNQVVNNGVCIKHGAEVKQCSAEGCDNQVVNNGVCIKHGAEVKQCSAEGCDNQVVNNGVCIKHGAEVKRCSTDGCDNRVVNNGVCIKHGAEVKQCSTEGCDNQVVNNGVCKKHGAKVKLCSTEGCGNQVVNNGVCAEHGAKVKRCSTEGCGNQVVNNGVCKRHGAKVKLCSTEGCDNHARKNGVCITHGAEVKLCSTEGCDNHVENNGVCKRHGAKVKLCSTEGCDNQVQKNGVCKRHGAKVKLCSTEGCDNHVRENGVCHRHGAKVKLCSTEGCDNHVRKNGVCHRHGANCCKFEGCNNRVATMGFCDDHVSVVKTQKRKASSDHTYETKKIRLQPVISTNQQSFHSVMPNLNMMSAQPPPLHYPPYGYRAPPSGLDFGPSPHAFWYPPPPPAHLYPAPYGYLPYPQQQQERMQLNQQYPPPPMSMMSAQPPQLHYPPYGSGALPPRR